jgi:DNA-binding transcriptional MocR family regulator
LNDWMWKRKIRKVFAYHGLRFVLVSSRFAETSVANAPKTGEASTDNNQKSDPTSLNMMNLVQSEIKKMHKRMQDRGKELSQGLTRAKEEGESWNEKREGFSTWANTYNVTTEEVASFLRFEA